MPSAPFRAEHIGSFKRPQSLLDKRNDFKLGKCTAEELKAEEDAAIVEIVKKQRDVGIKSISDGEFRRSVFFEGVIERLEGVTLMDVPADKWKTYLPHIKVRFTSGAQSWRAWICTGKLKRNKPCLVGDFEFLKSQVPPDEVKNIKVTTCSLAHCYLDLGSNCYTSDAYSNDDEFLSDLSKIFREEIADLYAAGCRNIQLDVPWLTVFSMPSALQDMKDAGDDPEAMFDIQIKFINDCLLNRPLDMNVGLHLCGGNYKGRHFMEGGYDLISQKFFREINVDCLFLEYDTERAGTFASLKYVPLDKKIILGLVSTKTGQLESPETLKSRINQAVDVIMEAHPDVTREQTLERHDFLLFGSELGAFTLDYRLCISPQCGFASQQDGNPLSDEEMWKKIQVVVDVAQAVWD